ncbi:MAG: EscU/YscU/HrcU family type III secretion system export apparatus switch protein [Acidobacteriaceae bacterium]
MSDDRTEKASPQRKRKARERGDIPHSQDLTSAAGLLAGTLALGWAGPHWAQVWGAGVEKMLALGQPAAWMDGQMDTKLLALRAVIVAMLLPLVWIFGASLGGAALMGVAQSRGLNVSGEALTPKFERLNPVTNIKNVFSIRGISRMAKSALPVAALAWFVYAKMRAQTAIPVFSLERLPDLFTTMYGLMLDAGMIFFLWSGMDYVVEWRSWEQRLKMSKQEVREEYKQTEGSPEVKRRIAGLRRQMRRRALKADVSRASVVITNPTHYAVALEFSLERMEAPKVLAKGRDLLAAAIKDEARWAGVPIVENPPLARALYKQVEVGQSIPFALYAAVAGILAWIYRREVEEKMRAQRREQARDAERAAAGRGSGRGSGQGSAEPVVSLPGFGGRTGNGAGPGSAHEERR